MHFPSLFWQTNPRHLQLSRVDNSLNRKFQMLLLNRELLLMNGEFLMWLLNKELLMMMMNGEFLVLLLNKELMMMMNGELLMMVLMKVSNKWNSKSRFHKLVNSVNFNHIHKFIFFHIKYK